MIPIRNRTIFRSRWMALLWAAGVIWLAVEVAGPDTQRSNSNANMTDGSGAQVNQADENALQEALNTL